jgi:hypothetical protein
VVQRFHVEHDDDPAFCFFVRLTSASRAPFGSVRDISAFRAENGCLKFPAREGKNEMGCQDSEEMYAVGDATRAGERTHFLLFTSLAK